MPTAFAVVLAWTVLLGLAIGSFLNVVAYRVPAGISLYRESRCPHCAEPIRWWQNLPVLSWLMLRGRCRSCAASIPVRYPFVEAATAMAFIGVVWLLLTRSPSAAQDSAAGWSATAAVILAYLWFAGSSIVLTLIDLDVQRLPNAIVVPGYFVGGILLTLACILGADWSNLMRAAIGMIALYAFYAILRRARPGGMGGGDVRLAGFVGLHLGWLGWDVLVVGTFAAFVFGGVHAVILLALRRAGRRTAIPFGPWMLAGAWFAIVFGGYLARWYLGFIP